MSMNWMRIIKYISIGLLTLLAILGIFWTFNNGKRAGQSRQVIKDGRAIQQALEYFYQDQNRYPSSDEFLDQNLMRQYLSDFPPQQFVSNICVADSRAPKSSSADPDSGNIGLVNFVYVNNFRNDYELRLCLPKGVQGHPAGWNKIIAPVKS